MDNGHCGQSIKIFSNQWHTVQIPVDIALKASSSSAMAELERNSLAASKVNCSILTSPSSVKIPI